MFNNMKITANNSSEYDDSSPCFGNKQKRKPDSNKNDDEDGKSFLNAAKESNNYSNSGIYLNHMCLNFR